MVDKDGHRDHFNILFLCTGNSARSILSECILNRLGAPRFRGFSAGSMPTGQVNGHAIALLKHLNYPTDGLRSKSWEEFAAGEMENEPATGSTAGGGGNPPALDFVFTVCDRAAAEVCPVWPGQPMTAHWGVPDPASTTGTEAEIAAAFADTYRMLEQRIDIFVNLPFSSLDRLALQTRLDAIGRSVAEATTG